MNSCCARKAAIIKELREELKEQLKLIEALQAVCAGRS